MTTTTRITYEMSPNKLITSKWEYDSLVTIYLNNAPTVI